MLCVVHVCLPEERSRRIGGAIPKKERKKETRTFVAIQLLEVLGFEGEVVS